MWEVRYNLGIWNNSVDANKVGEMYKIMKRNDKHLELYVKIDGRFKPVSKEVLDNVVKQHKEKEPERKEYRKKWKENNLNIRVKFCQRTMKTLKLQKKKGEVQKSIKGRVRRCKKILKKNKTKKRQSD